jgi:SAM-dependent methyltransferase
MKISQDHSNRKAHNWLIYNVSDSWLNVLKVHFTGTLYDLGCGESPYKTWLLNHADQYIGVDWSGSYHETTADIVANLNEPLPIENEVADTVLSLSVMEHLSEPQVMLKEANRILKPGGGLVLQVPWQWWIHEAPYDFFRYTPYGLQLLLERAGFQDICIQPQAGFFTTITLKMNYFSRRLIRGPKLIRYPILGVFSIIWFVNQKLAPVLDKMDRNWALEAPGYFVTARKPLATTIEP